MNLGMGGGAGYSSNGNLLEAIFSISIYPWRTNITIKVLYLRG